MRRILTMVLWAALFVSVGASAFDKPTFPRLGGYLIASPQNYDDATYQSQIERLNIAILNVWPGWSGSSGSTTMQDVVKKIKAANPNTLVFLYNIIDSSQSPAPWPWSDLQTTLDSQQWWLYQQGLLSKVVSPDPAYYLTNITTFTPKNSSGQRYIDWRASWEVQNFYTPDPYIDGFFTDNVFYKPRYDGDWNRDGVIDSQNSSTVQSWFRQGYATYINDLKSLMPGKYQLGNIADWGHPDATLTEYSGVLNGGVMEYLIGASYSVESWGGWQMLLTWYRKSMTALAEPKLAIFHQIGSPTDYQSMRYGLTTCLLDDAYFEFSPNDDGHTVAWFDEYDAKLGNATSSPPTSAWQNGVYRRDYENGVALVNPKGNGQRTVTLETNFKKIAGTQAPSVNSGQTVSTVTLNDRDGIILLRLTAVTRPAAPSSVSVQ